MGLIEDSVFKTNNSTSIFDDIENKIFEYEANIRQEMVKLNGDFIVKFSKVDEKLFETNNRISANEVLK